MDLNNESVGIGALLPQVGIDGLPTKNTSHNLRQELSDYYDNMGLYGFDPTVDNYNVSENYVDDITNTTLDIDVNYKIRKLISNIYTLQEKIALLELHKREDNSKELIDLKKKMVSKKMELQQIKKTSPSPLLKAIKKLEKIGKDGVHAAIKKDMDENKKVEEMTEGICMDDVSGYFTEMNHIKGILSNAVNMGRLKVNGKFKDTRVDKKEVLENVRYSEQAINEYKKQLKETDQLVKASYNKHKNDMIKDGVKLSDIVKIVSSENHDPVFHKFGKRYVMMLNYESINFMAEQSEKENKLVYFTKVLNTMRKMEQEIQKANKNKYVVIKCSALNMKKEKIKVISLGAYIRVSLGTEKPKTVQESDNNVSPEYKRLDIKRGELEELKRNLVSASSKLNSTGEQKYEKIVTGLTMKIERLEKELKKLEKELEEENEKVQKNKAKHEVKTEAANMEDEIKPIVETLNRKGYKVKYASPGHHNLRKKDDKEPDGVYYNKLYSDARIMFVEKYSFSVAPKYWHWREVDGCSYLDITPLTFNPEKENITPDQAFSKWKTNYMGTLKTWADGLKPISGNKNVKENVDNNITEMSDFIDSEFESSDSYIESSLEEFRDNDKNLLRSNLTNNILKELDDLLS